MFKYKQAILNIGRYLCSISQSFDVFINVDQVAPLLGLSSSNIEISTKIGTYSIHFQHVCKLPKSGNILKPSIDT